LTVTRHYYDIRGQLAYQLFELINASYFDNELPWPLILWALTAHGHCLAYTQARDRPPIVVLHPSILGGTEKENPWGVPAAWLNVRYAFDVLLHELMHVSVECRSGVGRVGARAPIITTSGLEK